MITLRDGVNEEEVHRFVIIRVEYEGVYYPKQILIADLAKLYKGVKVSYNNVTLCVKSLDGPPRTTIGLYLKKPL